MDSYEKGKKPVPVDISPKRIGKMKAMEFYRFLCMLEIYGSSPNIDVLD